MHGKVKILSRTPGATVYNFRCAACRDTRSGLEVQHGYEIALVRQGHFVLDTGPTRYHVDSRSIVLSNDGEEFAFGHGRNVTDECTVIRVAPKLLSDARDVAWRAECPASASRTDMLLPLSVLCSTPHLDYLHRHLLAGSETGLGRLGYESLVVATVSGVYAGIFADSAPPSPGTPREEHMEAIERAKRFAIEHLADDLSLTDLADHANLSVYHFARLFKHITTLSPYRYLTQVRLYHAARLLRDTSASVSAVTLEAGFHSLSHFTDSFSRFFGTTPTEYRRY